MMKTQRRFGILLVVAAVGGLIQDRSVWAGNESQEFRPSYPVVVTGNHETYRVAR